MYVISSALLMVTLAETSVSLSLFEENEYGLGRVRDTLLLDGKEHHFVIRFPGFARSSF
jgi:hypothetical protein